GGTPAKWARTWAQRHPAVTLTLTGLTAADAADAINALLEDKPEWLIAERESYQNVLTEQRRLKSLRAEKS
ncbi:MAG: hypothetical protein NT146_16820, partial [Mycobacterium sp.]|nr:hypothetical protein [Mycobacterium sp.]